MSDAALGQVAELAERVEAVEAKVAKLCAIICPDDRPGYVVVGFTALPGGGECASEHPRPALRVLSGA